jgi:ribosomal protein S18 acetylase RimI-like enzyme
VAASLRSDRLIVASINGSAVGFAGLEYLGKSFIEPNKRQAVRMLGFRGLLVRLVFWTVALFNRSMPGDINIRALAVSADNRGKGIGTKMLYSIIKYAKLKDFSKIKIEVTSANPNAKRLYTKIGFRASKVQKMPNPLSTIVGFDKIIELIYKL